jgi:hypothetical protein
MMRREALAEAIRMRGPAPVEQLRELLDAEGLPYFRSFHPAVCGVHDALRARRRASRSGDLASGGRRPRVRGAAGAAA